jgi:hypothetical protein
MMAAISRRRGATGERELCALLSAGFNLPIKRTLGQARDGGHDIATVPGFAGECKRRRSFKTLYGAMRQVEKSAASIGAGDFPTVFIRADHEKWLVTMRLEDWMVIAKSWLDSHIPTPPSLDNYLR